MILIDVAGVTVTRPDRDLLRDVSLTVSAVSDPAATEPWFEVSLIPETLEATTFDSLQPGSPVNLETDILARHVQRLLAFPSAAEAAPTEGGSR